MGERELFAEEWSQLQLNFENERRKTQQLQAQLGNIKMLLEKEEGIASTNDPCFDVSALMQQHKHNELRHQVITNHLLEDICKHKDKITDLKRSNAKLQAELFSALSDLEWQKERYQTEINKPVGFSDGNTCRDDETTSVEGLSLVSPTFQDTIRLLPICASKCVQTASEERKHLSLEVNVSVTHIPSHIPAKSETPRMIPKTPRVVIDKHLPSLAEELLQLVLQENEDFLVLKQPSEGSPYVTKKEAVQNLRHGKLTKPEQPPFQRIQKRVVERRKFNENLKAKRKARAPKKTKSSRKRSNWVIVG